jgi:hypothetical protein
MSLTPEEREELVNAIHDDAGLLGSLTSNQAMQRFHDSSWAALCHTTGRAGRYYQPTDTSAEARIYRLMSKAFGDPK